MLYTILGLCLTALAVVLTVISLKVLLSRRWLLAWLRGTISIFAIVFSCVLVAVAWDLISYAKVSNDKTIATVAVKGISEQTFEITVALPEGQQAQYLIKGDLWQVDARVISWSGGFKMIGFEPGYRLDRLSGRYIDIEAEMAAERTVYDISGITSLTDVWTFVNDNAWFPWVDAKYGSATYVPMADGALYAVYLNNQGVVAKPLNKRAEDSVNTWQ